MTNSDRFIDLLEDYLDAFDGRTPLPDRVRDAVRAELPSVRQAQPRPGPWRLLTMLSTAPAGARLGAAAAVVVAVVLGVAVFNNARNSAVGSLPTSTPSPTPAPSAAVASPSAPAPSIAALPPGLDTVPGVPCAPGDSGNGCIRPGTYRLSGGPGTWPATVSIVVPAGWSEWAAGPAWDAVLVDRGLGASGWGVMFYTVAQLERDPCDTSKGTIPVAQLDTPGKLAAAMAAWPHFSAGTVTPITVDGHSGVTFTLNGTSKSTCTDSGVSGLSTAGAFVDAYPMVNDGGTHDPSTVEIVDTGNGLLVIRATEFPQTPGAGASPDRTAHAGDLADLHAILDSIRISELSPGPSPSGG